MKVLLRILPLLVLSVFINPDSETCELIGDPKMSIISIRHNRSFSDITKIANFLPEKALVRYAREHVKPII
jgi:hypothetical protein